MKKILFVAIHRPNRSPGQRFRFEQYFNYLEENDYACRLSYIIHPTDDKYLYTQGHYFYKFWIFIKSFVRRFFDVIRATDSDIVFIQREAFMTGTTVFEKLFSLTKAQIVFDFDDAIWLEDVSPLNSRLSFLKKPSKTAKIIALADMVFVGNEYLAKYARQNNNNVCIIPTTVDTNEYVPIKSENTKEVIVIGWSGSFSTIKYFELALPALEDIHQKYGERVQFKVIGDGAYRNKKLNIEGISWSKSEELKELWKFDIGIMPLPNDKWAKGKCGLKGLQYMALEIPAILSPVGVNVHIIDNGVNGFLAKNREEWVDKLSRLIDSAHLRQEMGKKGRETVVQKYSVESQKHNYLKWFNELLNH